MAASVHWLLLGEIMRRIVATVVTFLFTLGIGALAAPAQAADWVTVVVSVDHADGTDATQSCVQLFSVEDAQWFELSCSASGGNHSGSVPEGEYRIFYRWDEQYNDQWQWYVGPTSSTLFQHEATIVAVSEGAVRPSAPVSRQAAAAFFSRKDVLASPASRHPRPARSVTWHRGTRSTRRSSTWPMPGSSRVTSTTIRTGPPTRSRVRRRRRCSTAS